MGASVSFYNTPLLFHLLFIHIPYCSGISGLIFKMLDLHLHLPYLQTRLFWFNDNINHFVTHFSEDGAPEISDLSMSIGSLTIWNSPFTYHLEQSFLQILVVL